MHRRKFIKATLAAATFSTLSLNLNAFATTTKAFTREEIEKGVKSIFSKNRIGKNAKFGWGSHFIKELGMDSLDTVEVIMDAEYNAQYATYSRPKINLLPGSLLCPGTRSFFLTFHWCFAARVI